MAWILIYRPHNMMHLDTMHIGPFASHDDAYDTLCELPALGIHYPVENGSPLPGCKYITELCEPGIARRLVDLANELGVTS